MRVLSVIDSLAPGGAERSLVAVAPHLMARGVELRVVALKGGGELAPDLEGAGVEVVVAPASGRWQRSGRIEALVRAWSPDLVHTALFEADVAGRVAARRARVPVVSSLTNTSYGAEHAAQPGVSALRLRAAQAVDIASARLVRRFHAVSAVVADTMA
ncbi:MAG: glycosyltransferase, partial [Acidimicrobiales bacterium]